MYPKNPGKPTGMKVSPKDMTSAKAKFAKMKENRPKPAPEKLIKKRERIMDKNIEASKVDRSAPASSGVQKRMDNVQSRAAAKSKRIMDEGYNTRNMLKSGITKAKAQNKVNKIYDRSKK